MPIPAKEKYSAFEVVNKQQQQQQPKSTEEVIKDPFEKETAATKAREEPKYASPPNPMMPPIIYPTSPPFRPYVVPGPSFPQFPSPGYQLQPQDRLPPYQQQQQYPQPYPCQCAQQQQQQMMPPYAPPPPFSQTVSPLQSCCLRCPQQQQQQCSLMQRRKMFSARTVMNTSSSSSEQFREQDANCNDAQLRHFFREVTEYLMKKKSSYRREPSAHRESRQKLLGGPLLILGLEKSIPTRLN